MCAKIFARLGLTFKWSAHGSGAPPPFNRDFAARRNGVVVMVFKLQELNAADYKGGALLSNNCHPRRGALA